jgi:hypothetical protein
VDQKKHTSIPVALAIAGMILGGAYIFSKKDQLADGEKAVRITVDTTADHERVADIEYTIGGVRDTVEDARLQWSKRAGVPEGTIVGVNAAKQGSDDPNAVLYCEIWVNDVLVMRHEADDHNFNFEDPPFVNCETAVL